MKLSERSGLIKLLDLTRLVENDTSDAVINFCKKATTPFGPVAAVCVYPEFVTIAKKALLGTSIPIATVANFPTGNETLSAVTTTIQRSLGDGAAEIDVVMPYQYLITGSIDYVKHFLTHCRALTQHHILKVIIESGELNHDQILLATTLATECGADFVKTSTGKVPVGATLEACDAMLSALSMCPNPPGIKLSGGVNTPEQAEAYLTCIANRMGNDWLNPNHVRIGASRLLDACLLGKL